MVHLALGATSLVLCVCSAGILQSLAQSQPVQPRTTCPSDFETSTEPRDGNWALVQLKRKRSSRTTPPVDDGGEGDVSEDAEGGAGDGKGPEEQHRNGSHHKELVTDEGEVLPDPQRVVVKAPPYLHMDWFTPTSFNITAVSESMGTSKKDIAAGLTKLLFIIVAASMLAGVIACLYDKRRSISLSGPETAGQESRSSEAKECDYVMIFPLEGSKRNQLHVSGTRALFIHWDAVVDGIEQARMVFMDPNKSHIMTEEELQERFSENMTHAEYSKAVCDLLTETLAGPLFGLEVEAFASVDHDEAFLKMRLPSEGETVEQYAVHFRYQVALSDIAYEKVNTMVPRNIHGDEVRAYAPYVANDAGLFQPFRSVDRIRLIAARLNRFIDVSELMKQQVLAEHFAVHEFEVVNELVETWANPRLWYRFPEKNLEDRIRDYFGEEVAWLFVWQTFFMQQLLVPTTIGFILFFRRWLLTIETQRKLQILFGLFMSVWVTVYNRRYIRYEAVLKQRWGMDKFLLSSIYVRDEYVPDHVEDGGTRITCIMLLGDMLAIGMVILCMIGVRAVHSLREHMMELHSHWVWQQGAAVLIACQILMLDMIWRVISQKLVNLENHRTPSQWNKAWVQKVFLVRFFNNLYPFLYIGFVKQFSYQGCPDTPSGCLDELQRYLFTYFVTRLLVHLASDMFLVFIARSQLFRETRDNPNGERKNMHLQIQAKSQDYDAIMKVDDWTENVLTFLFLTCFNVILPVIALLALLTTMLEARCLAHRNCCFLRRPVPRGAEGIGEWQQLLETVEFLAVLVNVGFAVFTMSPMKDLPVAHKVVIFVFIEHVILFLKHLIKEKFPEVPPDVEDLGQDNEEILRMVATTFERHKREAPSTRRAHYLKQMSSASSIDISPSSFGGRRSSRIVNTTPAGSSSHSPH